MSISLKLGFHPYLDHLPCQTRSNDSPPHNQYIGIVVFFRHSGGIDVVNEGRPNAGEFIGNNAHSDARTTDEYTPFCLASRDLLCHYLAEIWIVHRPFVKTTQVLHVVPQVYQVGHQIFLEADLFNAGILPAINAGLSVSRVGGAAQTKIIKKLGGSVRLALAQYRELAAFSQFASDLDDATRAQLEHGQRVTELMKQKQYSPLQIAEMGISIYAANEGYLKEIPLNKVLDFEASLLSFVNSEYADLMTQINESGDWNDELEAKFKEILEKFVSTQTW